MEPELKTYLEGMEKRIDTRFDAVEKKIDQNTLDISDVLEVAQTVKENTAQIIERIDDDILDIRQRTDNNSKRIDYLEKKLA